MKALKVIAASLAALVLLASCNTKKDPKVDAELPSQELVDSMSYLLGINFGYIIKANGFGENLNYAQIKKGMLAFINSKGDVRDEGFNDQFEISPELIQPTGEKFLGMMRKYNGAVNKAKGDAFLAEKFNESGVEKSESGLLYKIIEKGDTSIVASDKDTVWVNYTGTLIDGTEFDSNKNAGEPVQMMVNGVVPGFKEGLQLVGQGGKIELYIPAELGYGEYGPRGIEPNSTLVFEVEVTKVGKYVEPAPAKPAKKKK